MNEAERNAKYHQLFTSPLGDEVLADLRDEFYDIQVYAFGVQYNINDTVFAAGCRNVVAMILDRLEQHEAPANDNEPTEGYI